MILDRNNTNFQLRLFEHLKNVKWDTEYDFLKFHQNLIRYYIENTTVDGARGLLVFHETGTGKSLVIVSLAMDIIENGSSKKVIFLLSKSLHENLRDTIRKYIKLRAKYDKEYYLALMSMDEIDNWILSNFEFVSANASNMTQQLNNAVSDKDVVRMEKKLGNVIQGSLDNCAIFLDEAHGCFRGIINGSKNSTAFYEKTMEAKDLNLFFFTGTPINSHVFELVPCFNMLSGSNTTLPEDYKEFMRLFTDERGRLKNKNLFQNRLFGLISSVRRTSTVGRAINYEHIERKPEFPEEYPIKVILVPMSPEYYSAYRVAAEAEEQEGTFKGKPSSANLSKPKSDRNSSYHVKTRMLSNFYSPSGMRDPMLLQENELEGANKFKAIYDVILSHPNQIGLVYSQFVGVGGLGAFSRYLISKGYREYQVRTTLHKYKEEQLDDAGLPALETDENPIEREESSVEQEFHGSEISGARDDLYIDITNIPHSADWETDLDYFDSDDASFSDVSFSGTSFSGASQPNKIKRKPISFKYTSDKKLLNKFGVPSNKKYILILQKNKPVGIASNSVVYANYTDIPNNIILSLINNKVKRWGGIESITVEENGLQFAMITGNVPVEDRQKIVDECSSGENMHGKIISILLISASGAEGLDLKNGRYVCIMEPYWNNAREKQIIARFVRSDSHIDLPENERNVQPYIFLSTVPAGEAQIKTRDVQFYEDTLIDKDVINSFLEALREVSIECLLNMDPNCRVCSPNNKKLFSDNVESDINLPDPCTIYKETKFIATEFEFNEKKYYYKENKDSIYDYSIYMYNMDVNVYKPLRENTQEFLDALDHLLSIIDKK